MPIVNDVHLGLARLNAEIYVINANGTGQKNLTGVKGAYLDPIRWSPDGSKLAFVSYDDVYQENPEIHVINSDGTGEKTLISHPKTRAFFLLVARWQSDRVPKWLSFPTE